MNQNQMIRLSGVVNIVIGLLQQSLAQVFMKNPVKKRIRKTTIVIQVVFLVIGVETKDTILQNVTHHDMLKVII